MSSHVVDSATLGIALFLAAEAVVAIAAALYIALSLRPERGKEPFLDRLVNRDIRVAVGGAPIAFIVVYSLVRFAVPELGLGPILPPLGALLIGIPIAVMLFGPIDDGLTIWRERRRA